MKKPIISKEVALLMFNLGIELLKSVKDIYETKTEERILTDDDTTTNTVRDSKKDNNLSDRVTDTR
ncbi:MAG: hypothetical protein WC644_01190 [Ignavibacteria bacterium]